MCIDKDDNPSQLRHLNSVLRAARKTGQLVLYEHDSKQLIREACKILTAADAVHSAWILLFDEQGNYLDTARYRVGRDFSTLNQQLRTGKWNYCVRQARRQKEAITFSEPHKQCQGCPLSSNYTGRGAIVVPLQHGGRIYGTLTVALQSEFADDQEILDLFTELAGDLAFALYKLEQHAERDRSYECLSSNESKFRTLYENTPLAYQSLNSEGEIIDVNPAWLQTLGYERDEVIGTSFSRFLHPQWKPHFEKNFPAFKKRGYVNDVQFRILHKEGSQLDISFNGCIGYNTDGSVKQTYCVFQDITTRNRAEDAIQQAEQKYRALIEKAPDGVVVVGVDGRISFASPNSLRMFGYTEEELFAKDPSELTHPDDLPAVLRTINRVIKGRNNNIPTIDYRFATGAGGWLWIESTFSKMITAGSVEEVIINFRDVTERKLAQEELLESQRRLTTLMSNLPGIAYRCKNDKKWTMEFLSDGVTELTGFTPEELIDNRRLSYSDVIHPEDRQQVLDAVQQGVSRNDTYRMNYRIVTAAGVVKWVWEQGQGVEGDTALEGFITDITNLKQAEAGIRLSELNYQGLFENAPVPLWVEDFSAIKKQIVKLKKRGVKDFRNYLRKHPEVMEACLRQVRIVDVNRHVLKLHQADSKEQLLGEITQIYTDDTFEAFREGLIAIAEGQTQFASDTFVKTLEGDEKYIHVNCTIAPGYEESLERILISTTDITERRFAGKVLQESQERLIEAQSIAKMGDFTWDVSSGEVNWSEGLFDLLGYDRKEVIDYTRVNAEVHHPDDMNGVTEWFNDCLDSGQGELTPHEYRLIRRDGEIFYVRTVGIIERDDEGAVTVFATVQDVSERRLAEEEAREYAAFLDTTMEFSPFASWISDADGALIKTNQELRNILRMNDDVLVGRYNVREDLNLKNQGVMPAVEAVFRDLRPARFTIPWSGEATEKENFSKAPQLWIDVSMFPIVDEKGELKNVVCQWVDVTETKQMEELLVRSEQRFTLAVKGSTDILWDWQDVDSEVLWFSHRFYELLEYIEGDFEPTVSSWINILHPDDKEEVLGSLEQHLTKRVPYDIEYRLRTAGGEYKFMRARGQAQWNEEGRALRMSGSLQNVTELKQAGEELRLSEERFRALYKSSPDMYVSISPDDATILLCNDTLLDRTGYSKDELIGAPVFILYPEDCLDSANEAFAQFTATGEVSDWELILKTKDGNRIEVSLNVTAVKDQTGKILYSMSAWRDITERKQAEDALKESEARLIQAQRTAGMGHYSFEIETNKVTWSQGMFELLGYEQSDKIDFEKLNALIHHPDDLDRVLSWANDCINSEQTNPVSNEYRLIRKDGEVIEVHATASMKHKDGKPIEMIGTVQDITERKQAELSLQRSIEEITAHNQIVEQVNRSLTVTEVVEAGLEVVFKHLKPDLALIFLREGDELTSPAIRSAKQEFTPRLESGLGVGEYLCGLAVSNRSAIYSMDINCDLRCTRTECRKVGLVSFAAVPMYAGDEIIAVLGVASRRERDFKLQSAFIETAASEIAVGLHNAQLFDQLNENSVILKQEIAERIQTQEDLTASKETTERYLDIAAEIILTLDTQGRILLLNESGHKLLGYENGSLIGKNWFQICLPEANRKDVTAVFEQLILGDIPNVEHFENPIVTHDGKEKLILWHNSLIYDQHGEISGTLSSGEDITARKAAEEEILQLNKELEQRVQERTAELQAANSKLEAFAYSVSHDLRAPLRHIGGYVDLFRRRLPESLSEKGRHYLANITESTHQMGALIDDLLQFSRSGRQDMHKSALDMQIVLKRALKEIENDTEQREIEWQLTPLPYVYGDRALLTLVWINLLSNAVKFTRNKEQTRIIVAVVEGKEEQTFSVQDNGVGFDMTYVEKLFGVFQRLHSTADFEGNGIGLAEVQRIIARHGGRTWAEAVPGEGATFYFTLPRKEGT